jgi:hypothetical protein
MRWFRRDEPSPDERRPDPATTTPPASPPPTAPVPPPQPPQPPPTAGDAPSDAGTPGTAVSGPAAVPTPDQVVLPVTRDRVERSLREQGYRFQVGTDGSIGGNWDGNVFSIALIGPASTIVQVRGTWSGTIDPELAPGIAQVVNDWNRDRIWPKVYSRRNGTGLHAHTEVSVDLGPGATDAQIAEVVACGLGTGVQFFTLIGDLLTLDDGPSARP